MENLILTELKRKLKWKDRFIAVVFKKTSVKIYKIGICKVINTIL